jgi:hypothetical protein
MAINKFVIRTDSTTYSTFPSIKLIITGDEMAVGAIPVMKAASARLRSKKEKTQ